MDEDFLKRSFLFDGLTEAETREALQGCKTERKLFRRGELLCSPHEPPDAIILLLSGACDVMNDAVTLNTLQPGDCFGVLSLLGPKGDYPSTVIARKQTEVLLLPKADVECLMLNCPQVALNLVTFLSGRVAFLNRRIALLS